MRLARSGSISPRPFSTFFFFSLFFSPRQTFDHSLPVASSSGKSHITHRWFFRRASELTGDQL